MLDNEIERVEKVFFQHRGLRWPTMSHQAVQVLGVIAK